MILHSTHEEGESEKNIFAFCSLKSSQGVVEREGSAMGIL